MITHQNSFFYHLTTTVVGISFVINMEELRCMSAQVTDSQFSADTHSKDHLIFEYNGQPEAIVVGTRTVPEDDLIGHVEQRVGRPHRAHSCKDAEDEDGTVTIEPNLVVVHIDTDVEGALVIAARIFQHLCKGPFQIELSSIWLLTHKYDGYHHFPGEFVDTNYFGCSGFALLWSFDHRNLCTCAFYISRGRRWSGPGKGVAKFRGFVYNLTQHVAYVASPSLLGYIMSIGVCDSYDSLDGESDCRRVRMIEESTGYGYGRLPAHTEGEHDIDHFTRWLQQTGEILINNSGRKRTLRSLLHVLEHITEGPRTARLDQRSIDSRKLLQSCESRLLCAVPIIRSRIHAHFDYLDYMTVRTERLSAVVRSNRQAHRTFQ